MVIFHSYVSLPEGKHLKLVQVFYWLSIACRPALQCVLWHDVKFCIAFVSKFFQLRADLSICVLAGCSGTIWYWCFMGFTPRPENFTESPGKCRRRIQVHERHELCEIGQSFHCQVPHSRSVKAKEALMHFDIRKEAAASPSMAKHLLDTLIFCVPCVYLHLLALNVSSCAECWETKLVPGSKGKSKLQVF